MELQLEVPQVPECDGLVCGAGGEDELGVGVEGQAVDLRGVRVHRVAGPVVHGGPSVPDHQLLVQACRKHGNAGTWSQAALALLAGSFFVNQVWLPGTLSNPPHDLFFSF